MVHRTVCRTLLGVCCASAQAFGQAAVPLPENEPSPALEPPRHAEPNHGRHATEPETSALPWPGHRGRTHAGRHHGPGRPRLRSECRLLLHTDTQLAINFDGLIHVETAQQAEATAADDDPKT